MKGILNKKLQEAISLRLSRRRLRCNIKLYFQDIVRMNVNLNELPQHRRSYWDFVTIKMDLCFKGIFRTQINTIVYYCNGWNSHFFFAVYYLVHLHIIALVVGVFIISTQCM
jgi:hypothetical protein